MADQESTVQAPVPVPAPVQGDASKVLQDLLGISAMTSNLKSIFTSTEFKDALVEVFSDAKAKVVLKEAVGGGVTSGIKEMTADEDFFKLTVATISDSVTESVLTWFKKVSKDTGARTGIESTVTGLCNNESFRGALSDSVVSGMKRLLEDGEVQKSLANVGSMLLEDQRAKNVLTQVADSVAKKQQEFLLSAEFKAVLSGVGDGIVAGMKDVIGVSTSEVVENIKGMKITFTGELS